MFRSLTVSAAQTPSPSSQLRSGQRYEASNVITPPPHGLPLRKAFDMGLPLMSTLCPVNASERKAKASPKHPAQSFDALKSHLPLRCAPRDGLAQLGIFMRVPLPDLIGMRLYLCQCAVRSKIRIGCAVSSGDTVNGSATWSPPYHHIETHKRSRGQPKYEQCDAARHLERPSPAGVAAGDDG